MRHEGPQRRRGKQYRFADRCRQCVARHLDEVLLVLGELGTINIRRAYGNWAKTSLKGWEH